MFLLLFRRQSARLWEIKKIVPYSFAMRTFRIPISAILLDKFILSDDYLIQYSLLSSLLSASLNDADIKGGKMIETGGNYSSAIFMNTG